jgi:hypothetical protein
VDFGSESPRQVKAGRSLWRVENGCDKDYLLFVARVLPGHTYEETRCWHTNPEGPPPIEETGKTLGVHALSHGVYNDVDRGEYVLICFIDGHHVMGMVAPLTVTD